jgi:hypothetical protein
MKRSTITAFVNRVWIGEAAIYLAAFFIFTFMLPPIRSTLEICGQWEADPTLEDYSIFISSSVRVLSEKK